MRVLVTCVVLNLIVATAYCQKQYLRSDTFNIATGSIEGISDDRNLILNIKSGYSTICLFRDNKLVQKRSLGGEDIVLRGLIEQENFVHVFYGVDSQGKQQEGAITFYKDQSKNPTYKFTSFEETFLFAYNSGDSFHRILFSKKENKLYRKTFRYNEPDSTTEITVVGKELIKLLSRKEFIFTDSSTQDFEELASPRKAFKEGDKLVLLIDQDDSSLSPELVRIILDFNNGTIDYKETKHPFKPKTEHLSSCLDGKIYTWGINLDYFAMSIVNLSTLKSEKILIYLKQGNKIDLKATSVSYSVGPPLNDKYWQWNDPIIKRVDESKVEDILQQFLKGSITFKATKADGVIEFLFGTYQAATQPTRTYGVNYGTATGQTSSSSIFYYGIQERRKHFSGFLNQVDLTAITNRFSSNRLIRNRLDERIKSLFNEEKIGGMGGIVGVKKGYVAYILKKEKELIIEEM